MTLEQDAAPEAKSRMKDCMLPSLPAVKTNAITNPGEERREGKMRVGRGRREWGEGRGTRDGKEIGGEEEEGQTKRKGERIGGRREKGGREGKKNVKEQKDNEKNMSPHPPLMEVQ